MRRGCFPLCYIYSSNILDRIKSNYIFDSLTIKINKQNYNIHFNTLIEILLLCNSFIFIVFLLKIIILFYINGIYLLYKRSIMM